VEAKGHAESLVFEACLHQHSMSTTPYDPALDFFSEQFDPLKALSTPSVVPPLNVRPFDNLSKCRILLDPSDENYLQLTPELLKRGGGSNDISAECLSKRPQKTAFFQKLAEKLEAGPMGLLTKFYREKCRIKVYIRRVNDIRGYCYGILLAFDKHFNMVLKNVHEIYTTWESKAYTTQDSGQEMEEKVLVKKERRIKQLFVKGDTVVLVTRAEPLLKTN
jgi:small nuclear ribonucleoprotein (snRNP)-like protein